MLTAPFPLLLLLLGSSPLGFRRSPAGRWPSSASSSTGSPPTGSSRFPSASTFSIAASPQMSWRRMSSKSTWVVLSCNYETILLMHLFMVFNFREGERQSQLANILSEYDMMVMDYPRQYEGCPLLTLEMIHHYLRSSENWLSLGQRNILLMHCERGGWSALAFMLAALLIYRKQYTGEQKTLDMIYGQAPRELLQLLSPLNPLPSQLRYLQYVSRRNVGTGWPPLDRALTLDCVILRILPDFDGEGGCRPIFRIYGKHPLIGNDRTPKILYSNPQKSKAVCLYRQADCELIKIDICCHIRGDVVLECIHLDDDLEREMMMFRIMFNTAFIRSKILMLNHDEIDILWDAKEQFSKNFIVEVLLSDMDTVSSVMTAEVTAVEDKEGLPVKAFAKVQEIFNAVNWLDRNEDASLQHLNLVGLENDLKQKLDNITPQKPESKYIITEPSCEKFQIDASHKKIGESMRCSHPLLRSSQLCQPKFLKVQKKQIKELQVKTCMLQPNLLLNLTLYPHGDEVPLYQLLHLMEILFKACLGPFQGTGAHVLCLELQLYCMIAV